MTFGSVLAGTLWSKSLALTREIIVVNGGLHVIYTNVVSDGDQEETGMTNKQSNQLFTNLRSAHVGLILSV